MSSNEFRPTTSATIEGPPAKGAPTARPTTNFHPDLPSETVAPTQVSTPPQQAATQPESGGVQHTIVVQQPTPSFKQQVVGHAKEIRGTLLRKPETKEQGAKILHGEETWPPIAKDNTESSPTQTTGPQ